MNLSDLEEALAEILPSGFSVQNNKRGQIVILTNLFENESGELEEFESDFDDEDAESDPDFDFADIEVADEESSYDDED
jgi:hypothetical protein